VSRQQCRLQPPRRLPLQSVKAVRCPPVHADSALSYLALCHPRRAPLAWCDSEIPALQPAHGAAAPHLRRHPASPAGTGPQVGPVFIIIIFFWAGCVVPFVPLLVLPLRPPANDARQLLWSNACLSAVSKVRRWFCPCSGGRLQVYRVEPKDDSPPQIGAPLQFFNYLWRRCS
jgi:hypothetical protein